MTLEEYRAEYDRLCGWRERWTQLSAKHEPGRLQARQEAIERRARIANEKIGALILAFDAAQRRPYREAIQRLFVGRDGLYRQDIFDALLTPGRTNARLVSEAVADLERGGVLVKGNGPCSVHKGPLYNATH